MSEPIQYTWESPDGSVEIHLACKARDSINAAIAEAATDAPLRDAEIGGLLLGEAKREAKLVVRIDGVEPLACRYPKGPSFYLDPQDTPDTTRPDIVGYFRSHTRKGLFLSEEDRALIAERFADPNRVFLLVKPFRTRTNVGGFFYYRDGNVEGAASSREFPFGEPPPVEPPDWENDEMESRTTRGGRKPTPMWAGLGFLAVSGLGGLTYALLNETKPIPTTSASSPPEVSPGFALTASAGDQEISLQWERQSPVILKATGAVVEIQEGTFRKSLTLDPEELRHGSIVYTRPMAIAETVSFQMKVFSERREPVLESVRIVMRTQ